LRICSEAAAMVAPWGGGSATRMGNLPPQIDVVLVLQRLNHLVEHDHANLTVTVEAGMTLAELQKILQKQNQFVAFDIPYPIQATIGGAIAVNLNGPRRMFYGSIRDLVIGMSVALVTGQQIKAGGKVVKNVAGYDMCKLFVGSLGTLGIITEVTVRLSPLPEKAATLVVSGTLAQVSQLVADLRSSALLPAAIVVLNSQGENSASDHWQVAVWCEGFQKSVERHLKDVENMAKETGLTIDILSTDAHQELWTAVCDLPLEPNRTIFRLTVPLTVIPTVLEMVKALAPGNSSARIVADVYAGTIWISLDAIAGNDHQWLSKMIPLARGHRGNVVMVTAPPAAKKGIDVWSQLPASFSIMRDIKQQFDPSGILNPGRFVGGI
jgi:glycolate oxidase FAD binding subunit